MNCCSHDGLVVGHVRQLRTLLCCFGVLASCQSPESPDRDRPGRVALALQDGHGRSIESLDVGQTLVVGVKGLKGGATVRVVLRDASGGDGKLKRDLSAS